MREFSSQAKVGEFCSDNKRGNFTQNSRKVWKMIKLKKLKILVKCPKCGQNVQECGGLTGDKVRCNIEIHYMDFGPTPHDTAAMA